MGAPLSEWRKRVQALLEDGEWHEQEPVVRDAMRFVPPGPAYRHAEYARTRGNDAPRQRGDQSDAIAAGQRQMTMQSIHAAVRNGKIERKREGDVTYLRLTSGSPKRPAGWTESDDLAEELRRQLDFWRKAEDYLPKGAMKETLIGKPEESIKDTLKRLGRW